LERPKLVRIISESGSTARRSFSLKWENPGYCKKKDVNGPVATGVLNSIQNRLAVGFVQGSLRSRGHRMGLRGHI